MSDAQRPKSADKNAAASGSEGEAVVIAESAGVVEDEFIEDAEPDFKTDVDGNPIPSQEVLAEQALPAIYTRSPRLVKVVATSAAIGAGVGIIMGAALPAGFLSSRFAAAMVMGLAGALFGALIGGIVVAVAEWWEARKVAKRKVTAIDEWLVEHPSDAPQASAGNTSKDASP